ncbi:MAG: Hsp20/alpha crystallin family protein [Nocardioidaceae bacterium]
MLLRTDPFRDLDRLAQQTVGRGTAARPAVMAMDAWRENDSLVVEFDLPGVRPESLDIDVERNMLTVSAERPGRADGAELVAAERPTGLFSRQLALGDNLDLEQIKAEYDGGVLRLRIPVVAKASPRKISVTTTNSNDSSGEQAKISS